MINQYLEGDSNADLVGGQHDPGKTRTQSDGRRYLPSVGDLIDRLSIDQLKEVMIPEHKEQYASEIQDILHDLGMLLECPGGDKLAALIRAVVVLAQFNGHVWSNEARCRKEGVGDEATLRLTHGLNGIRVAAKNKINQLLDGGPLDVKVDCLAAEFDGWKVSW